VARTTAVVGTAAVVKHRHDRREDRRDDRRDRRDDRGPGRRWPAGATDPVGHLVLPGDLQPCRGL